jgi:serine/threonine-protein kinase RsbW
MEGTTRLRLPRDERHVGGLRRVTACLLAEAGAPDEVVEDLAVVVSEACGNVVRHAPGGSYGVTVEVRSDGCTVEVADENADALARFPDEHAPAVDSDEESGRGVKLMRALVDELRFEPTDEGGRLQLVRRWGG